MFASHWRLLASTGHLVATPRPATLKNVAWLLKILAWRQHAEHE
ncbi:hypothetical protein A2U01_0063091, partial [Trifolium medium]|nr:hypothetical protein [Trifolium medium]